MPIEYPQRLLPTAQRFNNFAYSEECFLVRRSIEKERMLDDEGGLEMAAIQAERFFDYSTNLVNNPDFKGNCVNTVAEDVLIVVEQKKYYSIPYNGDDAAVPSVYDLNADVLEKNGFFMIKVKHCRFKTTYPFPVNKPNSKIHQLELAVEYTPNVINICHFEFQCLSDNEKLGEPKRIKPAKVNPDTFREQIIHAIRNAILDNIHSIHAGN